MTRRKDCIDDLAEKAGVSREEALDAATEADAEADRLRARGHTDGLKDRVAQRMQQKAEEARIAAAQRRRHAALNAIRRDELDAQVDSLMADGFTPANAIVTVMEGSQRSVKSARLSVSNKTKAYERKFWGRIERMLLEDTGLKKLLESRDKTFLTNVRREWYELRQGGQPGVTGDEMASKAARMFADMTEEMRQTVNKAGANIGKLDGWTGTQTHDPVKILKVTQQEWVARVKPMLDLDRMFGSQSDETIDEVLGEVYMTIATGRNGNPDAAMRGDFKGPANMANALSRERVMHFASPDLAEQYNDMFGHGDILNGVFGSIETMSRTIAMMETFGPNPKVMLDAKLSQLQLQVRNDPKIAPDKKAQMIADLEPRRFDTHYDVATGGLNNAAPGRQKVAEWGASARTIQSLAKLGGSVLTAFPTDTMTMIVASANRGGGFVKATADTFTTLLSPLNRSERRMVAALYGEGMDAVIGNLTRGFAGTDGPVGHLSWLSQKYFRWNGLAPWTDAARSAATQMIAREGGMMADRAFDALPERYKWVLEGHDIDAARWAEIRASTVTLDSGNRYIDPDSIGDIETEMAWRRFVADETTYGIVEMDNKSRRWTALGNSARAGTFSGELIRTMMQFKGFPLAFSERVLGRAFAGGRGATTGERLLRQAPHIGALLGGLTVAGYVSLTAKDIARGAWPPRDYADPKTLGASIAQGGAFGIYGDFLFADSSNTRNSFLETLAGPSLGTLGQAVNSLARAREGEGRWSDAVNLVAGITPGYNLFYTRAALDYMFVNALREEISPGYLRRRERYRKKDYEQDLLFNERLF